MTYSFLDVLAAIAGPGLVANLGAGAAVSEEGISITPTGDKNAMNIGADGKGQHSLFADESGNIKIRLLKTSPMNAILNAAYELQSTSSSLWGRNVITITNPQTGDITTCQQCAFKKKPEINYAKEAGMIEWEFDAIKVNSVLGVGSNTL